jgi:glycosyltransferase involved in cell wall biosynthesis
MRISLVIPAYNEEAYLGGCLDSVIASGGAFHEIIVIDNASTDRTAEVAAARTGVRVVHESVKGLLAARQRGYHEATGEAVAYIDADTRMPKGWYERADRVLSARPEVVGLSGPARYWDARLWQRAFLALLWRLSAPLAYRLVGYMIYGANFVVRRSALDAIGGFNRAIEFYGEDTDLAQRLSRQGKIVFDMRFFIFSSARRFATEGMFRTNLVYVLNFAWPVLFGRPFTRGHKDVRVDTSAP